MLCLSSLSGAQRHAPEILDLLERGKQSLDLPEYLRKVLKGGDEAVVVYLAGPESLVGMAVTRSRIGIVEIPGDLPGWDHRVRRFTLLLKEQGFGRDAVPGAHALFRGLLGPLLESVGLERAVRLWILPDGPLVRLPFSALATKEGPDGTWLGFVSAIHVIPDMKTMKRVADRDVPAAGGLARVLALVVEDTASNEADRVVNQGRDGSVAISWPCGGEKLEAIQPRILHLTGSVRPAGDGIEIVSSRGSGLLDLEAAGAADLRAGLVVAPRIASGVEDRALAVSRPFLEAGVAAVLVTHWAVDERILGKFLDRYYLNLGKGLDAAGALVETRRTFSRSPGLGGPSVWAAFDVAGDGRIRLPLRKPFQWFDFWWYAALILTLYLGYRVVRVLSRASPGSDSPGSD